MSEVVRLKDRIVKVLSNKECLCVWPYRRSIDRLFLGDMSIPQSGISLWWAIRQLKKNGVVFTKNGYIALTEYPVE